LKDRLNISEILENTTLRSSYRVCRVGLAEEDIKDLENEKQKFVLTAIARTDVYDALGRPVYKPFFVNLFVPVSPEELRGGPSSFIPSPRTVEDAEVEAVHIEKVEYEEPNVCKLEDGTIASFKTAIMSIKRSLKYYDPLGMPLYSVGWSLVPFFESPKTLWRKEE